MCKCTYLQCVQVFACVSSAVQMGVCERGVCVIFLKCISVCLLLFKPASKHALHISSIQRSICNNTLCHILTHGSPVTFLLQDYSQRQRLKMEYRLQQWTVRKCDRMALCSASTQYLNTMHTAGLQDSVLHCAL